MIKPKLLKDIIYMETIFSQIYSLLWFYFRSCPKDETRMPEYDPNIKVTYYRKLFESQIRRMDFDNFQKVVCRNDEMVKAENQICIYYSPAYMSNFKHQSTKNYWLFVLPRIAWFVGHLLENTFTFKFINRDKLNV